MPIGAGGIAAITAAGAVLQQGANAYSVGRMNRKNRKFAENMYWTERNNALEDWTRTNEYNSPVEQMKRLKAAGLNPNLVYGNGVITEAAKVGDASFKMPNQEAPQFDNVVGETLSKYQQVRVQEQQLKNMEATEHLIQAQTEATLATAGLKNIDLDVNTKAHDEGTLDAERLSKYQKIASDAELSHQKVVAQLTQNEILEATKQSTITAAAEKVTSMRIDQAKTEAEKDVLRQRLEILKSEGILKALEAEFAQDTGGGWGKLAIKMLGILLGDRYGASTRMMKGSGGRKVPEIKSSGQSPALKDFYKRNH